MTVYLCGPMEGVSEEQMNGWRLEAYQRLRLHGIGVLDPCRRKKFHDQEYSTNLARRIVAMDLQDIDNSRVVLANLSGLNGARAWGSVSEITYGYHTDKIVITVIDPGYHHPFIETFSTEVHTDLKTAISSVESYYV